MTKRLLEEGKIGEADFKVDLISQSNSTSRPGYYMTPIGITIHNTGNTARGANAKAHTDYVDTASGYVSWHFTVDDKEIYQELPMNETAWHAGDGRGSGNMRTIAIEICVNEGIDFEKAKRNAYALIHKIWEVYPLIKGKVYPHQRWSGKYCPRRILDDGWDEFIEDLNNYYENVKYPEGLFKWAENGYKYVIENGISDGSRPTDPVTRQEVWTILYNMTKGDKND